jgi:oxygen-dependent protoporphyrinogen oxidase
MQPELMQLDDDGILNLVNDELRDIFGMSREPLFSEVVRYHRAMPQYHVGHLDRVAAIEDSVRRWPGLHLAGSAYRGVGIPDSIASGREAADQILCIVGVTVS